jgi:aminoglycoside phosphotransferase family enzyme/predicted kinase
MDDHAQASPDEESQSAAIAFLRALGAAAGESAEPALTHISRVFFAGARAFKLKRAVRTSYLDFATLEKRCAACAREVELNRRTAPDLYLGVRAITREPHGLAFDGAGPRVDCVVEMRRFDENALFDRLARRGALDAALMDALAQRIASLHESAQPARDPPSLAPVLAMNRAALLDSDLRDAQGVPALLARMDEAFARAEPLLQARAAQGKARRCHGDLTLRNIVLLDGAPTPFDCLEFDEALATIDVLYDLAFTLMDLARLGCDDLANALLNRYLDRADETDGLTLLPVFIAMRAVVRAHVAARMRRDAPPGAKADALEEEARACLATAQRALAPAQPPRLVAIGGLSGSGKSTLAAALAPRIGSLPGARVLSSDRIRKALFGRAAQERLPPEAYAPDVSARVYALMRERAQACLRAGWSVVADAVFDRAEDRAAIARAAQECGAPFAGVWLEAPQTVLEGRVAARVNDPSDADVAVLAAQARRLADTGAPDDWRRLDARVPAKDNARALSA